GCIEVIRRTACEIKTALTNCVGRRIDPIELRCGETSKSDCMGLPKIGAALGAGIHKSGVACVQQLGRSRLMRSRRNRVRRYSNTDWSREAYTSSTRVRYGVFAKRGPRWRCRDEKWRGVLVTNDGRSHRTG